MTGQNNWLLPNMLLPSIQTLLSAKDFHLINLRESRGLMI